MPEALRRIKHLEVYANRNAVRVHLDDGNVIESELALRFSRGRVGLVTKGEDGQLALTDVVKPATPGIQKFLKTVMLGTPPDARRPFLVEAKKLSINYPSCQY